MALDIQLDVQPDLDIQLDIQPDEDHKILSADLPLGALETVTTGGLGALFGVGAGVAGSVKGMLTPGQTAKEGWDDYSKGYQDSVVGKALAPQTESGKGIEQGVGKIIESMKDYAGDAFPGQLVGGIPGAEKLAPAVAGVATAIPELSMLLPFAGNKGKVATAPSLSKETISASFDKAKADAAAADVTAGVDKANEHLLNKFRQREIEQQAAKEKANNALIQNLEAQRKDAEIKQRMANDALSRNIEDARTKAEADRRVALEETNQKLIDNLNKATEAKQDALFQREQDRAARREEIAPARDGEAPLYQTAEGVGRETLPPEGEAASTLSLAKKRAIEGEAAAKQAIIDEHTAREKAALGNESGTMSLFDQGDQMGKRNQFNAGDLGDWRIDENGMPVRIDKSLEALNVEKPLQRGLWGDELGPALGQERSLTSAIDMMPEGIRNRANGKFAPGTTRQSALDLLRGEIKSDELRRAAEAANRENPTYNPTDTKFQPTNPLPTAPAGPWNPPSRGSTVKPQEPPVAPLRPSGEAPRGGGETFGSVPHNSGGHMATRVTADGRRQYLNSDFEWVDGTPSSISISGANGRSTAAMFRTAAEALANAREMGDQHVPTSHAAPSGVTIVKTAEGYVAIKDGKQVGKLESNMTPEQNKQLQRVGENLPASVSNVAVDAAHRGTGIGRALYDAWRVDHGDNVMPSGKTTADAWKYWKRNAPEKVEAFINQEAKRVVDGSQHALSEITDKDIRRQVAERADHMVNSKAVEITTPTASVLRDEPLPPAERPVPVDSIQTPRTPETIAAKQQQRQTSEVMSTVSKDSRLEELQAVTTPEEAKQLAIDGGMKDNAPTFVGRALGSGANYHAIMTNNPLIKFVNTVMRDARVAAEAFSRKYITAKDGLAPTWSKLSPEERINAMNALMEGDRRQMRVPQDILEQVSPNVRNYIEKFYEANKESFDRNNRAKAELGMKPVQYREGHVPGIFKGAYKSIVTTKDGTKAVLAVDSKWQMKKAIAHLKEIHPEAEFTEVKRQGLGRTYNQSDILSGMNDVIGMLAENDPRFAELQATISEAVKKGNNSIFNFNTHELSKKGVIGNEGNKPWLDAKENAESFHKAMIQYFEEGALHHEMQVPLKQIRDLTLDPELNMPKTKKYLDSYMEHVTGKNVSNPIWKGADYALDLGPRALGFGPATSLKIAGAVKNRMSQVFMGFGNWTFTAAQMVQPLQTGMPNLLTQAGKLGNLAYAPVAMARGGTHFMLGALELMTGKDMGMPDHMKQGFQYAVDRGLLNFSEMERAYEGSQSKFMRGFDKAAEFNMKAGELTTRVPMFLSYVDLFHNAGIETGRALQMAENITQHSMVDYHAWERPQLYGRMGVVGQFAGGLTTFKHNFVGQQVKHLKDASKGNVLGIAASAATMVALTGIAGAPFYDELDNLYGTITDKFFGGRKNIRDDMMGNLSEGIKTGLIPHATNIAIQSKFTSANMIPDYDKPGAAFSPQLSAAVGGVMDGWDVAKYGDKQAWANFVMDFTPSGMKGIVEDKMMNEDGDLMTRDRTTAYHRSPEEWNLRKWTGLRSNTEAQAREGEYRARSAMMADEEATKKISKDFGRSVRNDNPDLTKGDEYEQRAGEGERKKLYSTETIKRELLRRNLTETERAEIGVKPTPGSMKKFESYNKPGER